MESEAILGVVALVADLAAEQSPAEIEAHDGHPGESGHEEEVAEVTEEGARVRTYQDAQAASKCFLVSVLILIVFR